MCRPDDFPPYERSPERDAAALEQLDALGIGFHLEDQPPVPGGTTAIRGGQYVTEERAPGPPAPRHPSPVEPTTRAGKWLVERTRWDEGMRGFFVRINQTGGPEDMLNHVLAIEREAATPAPLDELREAAKAVVDAWIWAGDAPPDLIDALSEALREKP